MRYVTLPRADWDDDPRLDEVTTRTVIVDDEPVKTGLLDRNGTPLYRVRDRLRLGFHRS